MIQRNNRTPKPPPAPRARFMGFLKTIQTIWGQQHVKVYMQMLIIAYFSWKKCWKKSWVICILMNMSTDFNTVILVQLDLNDFDLAGIWKIPFSGFNSLSLCTKICKCAILLFSILFYSFFVYLLFYITKYYYLANLTRIHIEF